MKLRMLLGECCPQYSSKLDDMTYQKAQKILMQLRTETHTIKAVLGWSRQIQKQLDSAPVVDVSEVGEREMRHGRMNPDKFKKLTKDQRDQWIDFHQRLLDVAQQIIKDTEASVQTLNSCKDILALIVEPVDAVSNGGSVTQQRVTALRDRYFKFAQSIKSEGRIRVRYLRILQDSHNLELLLKWNEQLQNELKDDRRRADELDEFLSATKSIFDELSQSDSGISFEKQRQDLAIVKSKRDILEYRLKINEGQASSWAERANQAQRDNKPETASEAERRRQTFETSVRLYRECFAILNKLYEQLNARLKERAV